MEEKDSNSVDLVTDRPEPPIYLTAEQKSVWFRIVNAMPADWVTDESADVLVEYCRHKVKADKIAARIDATDFLDKENDTQDLDRLGRMADREAAGIIRAATKLRLTNQSRYDPITAGRKGRNAGKQEPWH